jgi:AraC-like DNA-binding protein
MVGKPILDALSRLLRFHANKPPLSRRDQEFLERLRGIVAVHQSESTFSTSDAAAILGMSRMALNRRLRALTGQSTHQYIRCVRLEGARALLSQSIPVAFIAQSVGFKSTSHFARAFREQFGASPSAYRSRLSHAREPPHTNIK